PRVLRQREVEGQGDRRDYENSGRMHGERELKVSRAPMQTLVKTMAGSLGPQHFMLNVEHRTLTLEAGAPTRISAGEGTRTPSEIYDRTGVVTARPSATFSAWRKLPRSAR